MIGWLVNNELGRMFKKAIVAWVLYGICMVGMGNTTKNFSQYRQSSGWDFNPGPPKYEAEVLRIKLQHSIAHI